jgi:hypothetical protein
MSWSILQVGPSAVANGNEHDHRRLAGTEAIASAWWSSVNVCSGAPSIST